MARRHKPNRHNMMAGALIIIAVVELVLAVLIAQHLYPNYSLANNYISDLGVGPTAPIFNIAVFAAGIMMMLASVLLCKLHLKYRAAAFMVSGLGLAGVGLFPESTGSPHILFATIAFGAIGVTALGFSMIYKGSMRYYSLASGLVAMFFVVLFAYNLITKSALTFGLGHGGLEEILYYVELLWALVTGTSIYMKKI